MIEPKDVDAILEWCDAYDPENATTRPTNADADENRWGETRSASTLTQWLNSTGMYARDLNGSLLDTTANELNQSSQNMYDGQSPAVQKDDGLAKSTMRTRQNCIKVFLREHPDATADPDNIMVFDESVSPVDPEDMLTREEFHALRNAPEHPRDRAIVDLFLYTGQRSMALRTLRIKDVKLDEGKYRLNDNADGLKGADLIGTWNPLLGAVGSIRDWLKHHPDPHNPNAYLLTERRDSVNRDATSTISGDTVIRRLRDAAEKAAQEEPGIENKPITAHTMRHNFVTMCKVHYDMDDDVVKRLIRHKPESNVMSTTYKHLSDEDYIKKAKEAFGLLDEDEDESRVTPEHCDVCHEPLSPSAKACSNCGMIYAPDSEGVKKDLKSDVREGKEEADTLEEYKRMDRLERLVNENPELIDVLESMVES